MVQTRSSLKNNRQQRSTRHPRPDSPHAGLGPSPSHSLDLAQRSGSIQKPNPSISSTSSSSSNSTTDTEYEPSELSNDPEEEDEEDEEEGDGEEEEEEESDIDVILHVLQETHADNPVLVHELFVQHASNIHELTPDIIDILSSEYIKDKHKIRLCELYAVLMSQDIYTVEWIELRNIVHGLSRELRTKIRTQASIDTSQNAQQKLKEFKELKHYSSQSLKDRIVWLDAPLEIRSCIYHKYKELMSYDFDNSEYPKLNTWLQYALKIPYNILKPISASSDMSQFLTRTYDKLNEEFYGLRNVKEQILLYLSTKLNNPAAKNFSLALVGSKGVGKCFAKDTPILMHDGKVKKVQNVAKGDKLMGLDGEPRIVLQLMKGYDTMYEVHQKVGMTYTVCKGHLLVLKCIHHIPMLCRFMPKYKLVAKSVPNDVVHIPVETFYAWSKTAQQCFVGIHITGITPVTPSPQSQIIDPYLLGMWLGSGCSRGIRFTVPSTCEHMLETLQQYALMYKSELRTVAELFNRRIYTFRASDPIFSLKRKLTELGVWGNLAVPSIFSPVHASADDRRKLVAGFLDMCALYINRTNTMIICCVTESPEFIDDMVVTMSSIGLRCKFTETSAFLHVTGDFTTIPTVIHKPLTVISPCHNYVTVTKDRTNPKNFYYGFESSHDHQFLLIDYTLVHNCFAENTLIRMYDGDLKKVQNINRGDMLMGDNSSPRIVMQTTQGEEDMYRIQQSNGRTYVVNGSHILSLQLSRATPVKVKGRSTIRIMTKIKCREREFAWIDHAFSPRLGDNRSVLDLELDIAYREHKYLDLTVSEYLQLDPHVRECVRGYKKSRARRVPVVSDMSRHDFYLLGKHLFHQRAGLAGVAVNTVSNIVTTATPIHDLTFEQAAWVVSGMVAMCVNNPDYYLNFFHDWLEYINIDVRRMLEGYSHSLDMVQTSLYNVTETNRKEMEWWGFQSELKVTSCGRDRYYGFTLNSLSKNRRFLLDDGTVVHNTHISRTIAEILDFPFEQISMGSITDPSFLTGHDYTYTGSKPGAMIDAVISMKCRNGIVFLDEFDKVHDNRIYNTLLHAIDPVQNKQFVDHYLGQDIKVDLSNLWFIFAMNQEPSSGPLKDRMTCIHIDGYNMDEKVVIAHKYLLPRLCRQAGLKSDDIVMDADMAMYLIGRLDETDNKGVRYIERQLDNIVNKVMFNIDVNRSGKDVSEMKTLSDLSFLVPSLKTYPIHLTEEIVNKFVFSKPYYRDNDTAPYKTMYM